MNIAIIFAGGSGVRMGAGVPKQFLEIGGKPIIIHTLQLFQRHPQIDAIYVGITEGYEDYMRGLAEEYRITKIRDVLKGGETAQDTIYNLLKKAQEENPADSVVLLHDGVRPNITFDVISANIESVKQYGSAITSTPCFETIVVREDEQIRVPFRKDTYAVQAPQSFYLSDIVEAHEAIQKRPERYENMIDACTILRTLGRPVHLIEGNRGNIKVTTPEDVYIYRALMQYRESEQAFGIGETDRIRAHRAGNGTV